MSDFESIHKILAERQSVDEAQGKRLDKLMLSLFGDEETHVEGFIDKQTKFQQTITEQITEILDWKHKIDLLTSKKVWMTVIKILLVVAGVLLAVKHGWAWTLEKIEKLFL